MTSLEDSSFICSDISFCNALTFVNKSFLMSFICFSKPSRSDLEFLSYTHSTMKNNVVIVGVVDKKDKKKKEGRRILSEIKK